jgi:hypothetical protein
MERQMNVPARGKDPAPYVLLQQQFRTAPLLRALVSDLFYDGRLEDGPGVEARGPISSVALTPLLVVNVIGADMNFSRLHQSYENQAEARVVRNIYEFLLSSDFDGVLPDSVTKKDICILSPFNRHKDRLRIEICGVDEETANISIGNLFGRSVFSPQKKSQAIRDTQDEADPDDAIQAENIDTVDKFQGSERKVVIISTCGDNKPLRAEDPHFINVACSRAQHLLVVVGNFTSGLATDRNWSFIHSRAQKSGNCFEHNVRRYTNGEYNLDYDALHSKLLNLLERMPKKPKTKKS